MTLRRIAGRLAAVVFGLALAAGAAAQSLDPRAPTPMSPGENRGTVDNQVGAQYWSFRFKPGQATLTVRFTSMGLFGNPTRSTIEVVLHAPDGKIWGTRTLTSNGQAAELSWPANFPNTGTASVELRPNGSALVRGGGDYAISFAGPGADLGGGGAPTGRDPIVGTYAVMVCAPDFDCQSGLSIRFKADGSVLTTDGHQGKWTVFDPDSRIYTVVVGPDRWSMKLVPGRGLFATSDLSVVVFQAVRPN